MPDACEALDARGAIVKGPYHARFAVMRPGFVADSWFEDLPGAKQSDDGKWLLPHNVIPYDVPVDPFPVTTPSGLTLRQYQIDAIRFALGRPRGSIVALDVGLGKTAAALHIALIKNLFPLVIVGPKLSIDTWCADDSDALKHYGIKVGQLKSTTPDPEKFEKYAKGCHAVFLNYEILKAWAPFLIEHVQPKMLIIDEAHTLRNPTARSIAAMEFGGSPSIQHRLMLTATPVVRSVIDLWQLANFCEPGGWGKRAEYGVRYENWTAGEYGWIAGDETNTAELRQRLSRVLYHRSRFDVRDDLPNMARVATWFSEEALDAKQHALYRRAEKDIVGLIREKGGNLKGKDLQRYTTLSRTLSEAKVPCAVQTIDDMLIRHRKVFVATWYRTTAWAIYRALQQTKGKLAHNPTLYGVLDSDTRDSKRKAMLQAFWDQEPTEEGTVFIATIGTTGMSMNKLVCASGLYVNDLHWLPYFLLQLEGRVHREGQKASNVEIVYGLVKKSMDAIMYQRLEERAKISERVAQDPSGVRITDSLGGVDDKDEAPLTNLLKELAECSEQEWEL